MTPIEAISGLAGSPEITVALVFGFFKVTVLLGLALLVRMLLSRAHPDRRHLLLRLTLVAVVLLPLLSFALPTLNLPVFGPLLSATTFNIPDLVTATPADGRLSSGALTGFPWTGYFVLIWPAGALAVLLYLGFGLVLRSRILRQSRPFNVDSGLKLAHELSCELEIREPVHLAVSSAVGSPVAWSFPKPTIILGTESVNWNSHDLRMAFKHELCHIKRRDDLWMLVGALATILYWYNPLVWLVRNRLTLEADNVCDAYVVNSGANSTVYARFMLAMARQCSAVRTTVTIGSEIIGKKQLEVRIMSIQEECIRTIQVRRSLVRLAWVLALSISIPIAAMQISCGSDSPNTTKIPAQAKADPYPSPDLFVAVDSVPVALHLPNPIYPDSALNVGLEGDVSVQVLVDKAGNAADARIKKTSGHECFDRSALEAAKKSTWKPALLNGQAVAIWVSYQIKFQLKPR